MIDGLSLGRFIPLRKADLVAMCLEDGSLSDDEKTDFGRFSRILEALLHYEYHGHLERLKNAYAAFDPDTDTPPVANLSIEDKTRLQKMLVKEMTVLLDAANFEQVTTRDLQDALVEESLFKVRLEVDFDDFEEILFFRRGESVKQETVVSWWGLRKRQVHFTNYSRVVVYLKFKEADYFTQHNRKNLTFVPGATLIKLFHNVPKADLEMLFPNSEVRMKPIDKLIIGVPAAVSGVVLMATKLGATFLLLGALLAFWFGFSKEPVHIDQKHLVALGAGLGTLAGFLFKQFGKFKNRKIRFMKALTENLYFKNLDCNAGVFHHLIDAAEEEEFKEVLLAYFILLTAAGALTDREIDSAVERWLEEKAACRVDFEISDALAKLERLKLVLGDGQYYRSRPLTDALENIDLMWDKIFTYHQPA